MLIVRLERITHDPEDVIVSAATVSTSKQKRLDLIYDLIKWGHHSPLEHAYATFYISGISRACANQMTRHRIASFVQESLRYTEASGYVLPRTKEFADDIETRSVFSTTASQCFRIYKYLLSKNVPKEDARYILPLATSTSLYFTANFREFRHFITLRADKSAQWEIREVAMKILDILYNHAPRVFRDLHEMFYQVNNTEEGDQSS